MPTQLFQIQILQMLFSMPKFTVTLLALIPSHIFLNIQNIQKGKVLKYIFNAHTTVLSRCTERENIFFNTEIIKISSVILMLLRCTLYVLFSLLPLTSYIPLVHSKHCPKKGCLQSPCSQNTKSTAIQTLQWEENYSTCNLQLSVQTLAQSTDASDISVSWQPVGRRCSVANGQLTNTF